MVVLDPRTAIVAPTDVPVGPRRDPGSASPATLVPVPRPPSDRPVRIADAALELIAASGLHAVTHRTIDARLEFPPGTTSYYARTRAELIARALDLLIARFDEAMAGFPLERVESDEQAIDLITTVAMLLEGQENDQIARFVLLIDLRGDPELHPLINSASPGQQVVQGMATALIARRGIPDAEQHATSLLALVDGLMLARLAGGSEVPIRPAVATYWAGMRAV